MDWLLEERQPPVKYRTLTELQGRSEKDPEVKRARKGITEVGWAKDILDEQLPGGSWVQEKSLFSPTFHATFWKLLVLSDLGLTKEDPRIDKACQLWMKRNGTKDGGFSSSGKAGGHLCITGNSARALVKFGYADHPKVKRAFEWIVKNQAEKGGWSCWNFGKHPYRKRTLDSWEPLSAFAVPPTEVDAEHETGLRKGRGVLPGKGAPQGRSPLGAMVPFPLSGPLLLRPARRA